MPEYRIVTMSGDLIIDSTQNWPEIQSYFASLREASGDGFDAALLHTRLVSMDHFGNMTMYSPREIKHCVLGMPQVESDKEEE